MEPRLPVAKPSDFPQPPSYELLAAYNAAHPRAQQNDDRDGKGRWEPQPPAPPKRCVVCGSGAIVVSMGKVTCSSCGTVRKL